MKPIHPRWMPCADLIAARGKRDICQWAEDNIILSGMACNERGPLRLDRTPYIRGILEAFESVNIEHISAMMGRQLAKTTGLIIIPLAYVAACDPSPASLMLPDKGDCESFMEERITPIFKATEAVAQRLPKNPDHMTKRRILFSDMVLSTIHATSTHKTMSKPRRILCRDEINEMKQTAANSASPLASSYETTTTFGNRKVIDTSTPTNEHGNIEQNIKQAQLTFEYYVACPKCRGKQVMVWDQIKFDSEMEPHKVKNKAYYECLFCANKIKNQDKEQMVIDGQWYGQPGKQAFEAIMKGVSTPVDQMTPLSEALQDYSITDIAFQMPKWYGLFSSTSFGEAAKTFLEANELKKQGEIEPMKDFTKFWRGLPYVDRIQAYEVRQIHKNELHLGRGVCPAGTVAITCGIDAGQGGFWYDCVAWTRDYSAHLVDGGFLDTVEGLNRLLYENMYTIDGDEESVLRIWKAGLDTGGSKYGDSETTMTEEAYNIIRSIGRGNFYGIKGSSHDMGGKRVSLSVIDKNPQQKGRTMPGGLVLLKVDTSAFKDMIHLKLQIPDGEPGRYTLYHGIETEYGKHLAAEQKELITKGPKKGEYQWTVKSRVNHRLDTTVIAYALADASFQGGVKMLIPQGQRRGRRVRSKGVRR